MRAVPGLLLRASSGTPQRALPLDSQTAELHELNRRYRALVGADSRAKLLTFRITFEGSDRVERVRAEAYRSAPPLVEFVVTGGEGLDVRDRVVATFDGREVAWITTTG